MSELLGVLFAIFVGTLIIPKFVDYQKISNNNTRAATTAQQQKQLNAAATSYIQQNAVAIQAIATPTTPAVITVAMLQAAGVNLLPTSFSATNPYGQTWQVQVLEPTAGNLQALAMSTGGTALPDAQATKVATIVGATGGFIPQNDSGIYPSAAANAYGAFAGWTIPTASYTGVTGGHPASLLTFNHGQLVSNYLYRNAVPGQPQLNQMNTPLVMASVQTIGTACTAGSIARDSTGALLSCNVGTLLWKAAGGSQYWQDPVANYASLPACNAAALNATRAVQTPLVGAGPRIYTCNGTSWQPLSVDDNGNLSVPKSVTAASGKVTIWDQPTEGGVVTITANDGTSMHIETIAGGKIRLLNSAWNTELASVDQSGNVTASKVTAGKAQLNDVVVENTGCSPNGLVARDAVGALLSCRSGVWGTLPTSTGEYVMTSTINAICGYAEWWIETCGRRYCAAMHGPNSFGFVTEAGGGFNFSNPWASPPTAYNFVSCTK